MHKSTSRLIGRNGKVSRKSQPVSAQPVSGLNQQAVSALLTALGINPAALAQAQQAVSAQPVSAPAATVSADLGKVTFSLDGTRQDGSARRYKASHRVTVNGRKATVYSALYFDKA